jgi:hypothetical protein
MRFRRRRSRWPRVDWRRAVDSSAPLKGQLWTRSEKALKEPDVHWGWRALAGAAAVVECALLVWLLVGPALAVRSVQVSGARHMTTAQVVAAAGFGQGDSVLSVDDQAGRRRLLGQTWVRAATVEPLLTGTVRIQISEWQPVAAYHAGPTGKLLLLSDQAVVLGQAQAVGTLVNVQGPGGPDLRVGERAMDPELLVALVNVQRGFPGLIGQQVAGFLLDSCGNLTLLSARGWKVYFGRVLTPEEFASLHDKLAALKAIAGHVDYNSTDLDYINVMNPSEPAAAFKSQQPPPPSPAPGAHPTATPAPVCK